MLRFKDSVRCSMGFGSTVFIVFLNSCRVCLVRVMLLVNRVIGFFKNSGRKGVRVKRGRICRVVVMFYCF